MTKEELNAIKVKDIIRMPEFKKAIELQMAIEEKTHTEAILSGQYKRTPLDNIRERGLFEADKIKELFEGILNKSVIGLSSREREYVYGIGFAAYCKVITKLKESVEQEPVKEVSI